jgi:DNA helicase HerA-like ATPase
MVEDIGITVGFITPNKLVFATKKRLKFGELVCLIDEIDGKDREILARVSDIIFTDPVSLRTVSPALGTSREFMSNVTRELGEGLLIVQSILLGYVDDDFTLRPVNTIIRPGIRLSIPDKKLLEQIIQSKMIIPLRIGTLLQRNDVDVYIASERLVYPTLVTGETGSGKSSFGIFLAREASEFGYFPVIFDFFGQYIKMSSQNWVNFVPANRIRIDFFSLGPDQIAKLIDASEPEERVIFESFERHMRFDSLEHFIETLKNIKMRNPHVVNKVLFKLKRLANEGIFGRKGIDVEELLKRGTATIIDLSTISAKFRDTVLCYLLEQISSEHALERFPNFRLLIFDEFHAYDAGGLLIETLLRISRMSRKYKTGLCFITQSPSLLPPQLVRICENFVVFRTSKRRDISLITEFLEYEFPNVVQFLQPGEAYVCGAFVPLPLTVKIKESDNFV